MAGVVDPQALARTYSVRTHDDPWAVVEEYRTVMSYHDEHPDEGSGAVSTTFDLPRGRVHNWLEGGKPEPVKAIKTADENGWIDSPWESDIGHAFNTLVAAIFSSGGISTRDHVPTFVVSANTEPIIRQALDTIGCGATAYDERPNRSTELVPAKHKAHVGRALTVLGAPVGRKNDRAEITLPDYLASAPAALRVEFVRVYVTLRGVRRTGRDTDALAIKELRSKSFHESLAELIESVTDEQIRLWDSEMAIWLSPEALADLDIPIGQA
jgi:hypothetical protein